MWSGQPHLRNCIESSSVRCGHEIWERGCLHTCSRASSNGSGTQFVVTYRWTTTTPLSSPQRPQLLNVLVLVWDTSEYEFQRPTRHNVGHFGCRRLVWGLTLVLGGLKTHQTHDLLCHWFSMTFPIYAENAFKSNQLLLWVEERQMPQSDRNSCAFSVPCE